MEHLKSIIATSILSLGIVSQAVADQYDSTSQKLVDLVEWADCKMIENLETKIESKICFDETGTLANIKGELYEEITKGDTKLDTELDSSGAEEQSSNVDEDPPILRIEKETAEGDVYVVLFQKYVARVLEVNGELTIENIYND